MTNIKFLETYISRKTIECWVFALLLFVLGWILQHCLGGSGVNMEENIPVEIYRVTAQSLLIFIPFVGVMVIFGFQRIKDAIRDRNPDLPSRDNLRSGWENGVKLFLSFSFYISLVVITNLVFLIFHKMIGISLGILFWDIGLVFGALYLMAGIAVKIFDVDRGLI